MTDLRILGPQLRQQLVTAVIISLVIALPLGSVYSVVPTCVAIVSVSAAFSAMALDEQNHWDAFRATLPLTRRDIMAGRVLFVAAVTAGALVVGVIASAVACAAFPLIDATWGQLMPVSAERFIFDGPSLVLSCGFALILVATLMLVTLPLAAKFGMTKAIRFIPLAVFAFGFVIATALGSMVALGSLSADLDAWFAASPLPIGLFLTAVAVVLFAAAATLSAKVYQTRQF
ncbi:MAG: ABC-2 transporter permease [Coriobacteriia bacterium]|nr:ABC-2 transporter permease [Coriobacteriia bacterium]